MSKMSAWDTPIETLAENYLVAVSFGGGLNSTALLVRWALEGHRPPHRITFADTGSERPETYWHILVFNEWLVQNGMPEIRVTRKGGRQESLEEYAIRTKHLPALAYGGKSCSLKFKVEPQERDINRWDAAKAVWKSGEKVVKIIGYGAEEQKRISKAKLEDEKYYYRFPLDEWQMHRSDCENWISLAGLDIPPKSSCFFCPSTKKAEILALPKYLQERAIRIEDVSKEAGNSRTTKGLGRQFSWRKFIEGAEVPEATQANCMFCIDEPLE